MTIQRILVPTHAFHIYLLSLDTSSSPPTVSILSDLKLEEQPSYALQHSSLPDVVYVNSWVDNKLYMIRLKGDQLVVEQQIDSGGQGPTFLLMTKENDALLVAHYKSGHLVRHPLNPHTGEFLTQPRPASYTLSLPYIQCHHPRSHRCVDRQSSSHPHQIVPLPLSRPDHQEYLVPDLGGDRIFIVTCQKDEGWRIVSETKMPEGTGPRHCIVNVDEKSGKEIVYLISELASQVTVHVIDRDRSTLGLARLTQAINDAVYPTYPPSVIEANYVPKSPYEAIAAAIIQNGNQIMVGNRDLHGDVAPEGDSVVIFEKSFKDPSKLKEVGHLFGGGKHLRGIEFDPTGKWLIVFSREGDGLTLYHKEGEKGEGCVGGWKPVLENILKGKMEKPIGAVFLRGEQG